MYIVTFYSFRGGVGRTTALVNVGFELARRGGKVLLVDFDLESPDLTGFPPLKPPEPHPGIVEYVAAYRETGESPDVMEYLYPVETDGQKGSLWVMPAGRGDPDYWQALADIDWQGLYDRQDGFLFFEDTRAQWEQLAPDYVLIDTHAGITPALGISTRQLADAVIIMFNPNRERGDELQAVSNWIGEEAQQTGRKPIEQFEVPSWVVEADERPRNWFGDTDGWEILHRPTAIPFSHTRLLRRQVVEERDGSLAQAYRRLANALIADNFAHDRDGARVALCEIHTRPGSASGIGDGVGFSRFEKLEQIIESYGDDADIQAQAACCLFAGGRSDRALRCLDRAIDLQPNSPALLWQRASYRLRDGRKQLAVEDLLRLIELSTRHREVIPGEASLERLKRNILLLAPKRPRFALPEGFEEEPAGPLALPDYSDPLIHVSGVDPYVASALRQLRQLDPDRYEQVKKNPYFARLSVETQRILNDEQLKDREDTDLYKLVRSHEWARLQELLQPRVEESELCTLEDAILLFLACWGLGNEQELQACGKIAIERFNQLLELTAPEGEGLSVPQLQIMAVVFWKTGERDYPRWILDAIHEAVTWTQGQQIFSYWHCAWVVWKRFKEDEVLIRQLFDGDIILPPFLRKEPAYR